MPSGECVRQADIIIHHIYNNIPYLYKARELVDILSEPLPAEGVVKEASGKRKQKNTSVIV